MSKLVEAAEKLPFSTLRRWLKSLDPVAKDYTIHTNSTEDSFVAYAFPPGQYENLFSHTIRIRIDKDVVQCSESDLGKHYVIKTPRGIKAWIKKVEAR